ncbi:ArsR family transcriptional regulator [Thermoplasmatota archaeon]
MGNNNLFKALSSHTRMEILKKLLHQEIHISELSRELNISVPVISRHIKILENSGLIKKKIIGNMHLISADFKNLDGLLKPFIDEDVVEITKDNNLFDALKQIPGVEVKKVNDKQYITSINGENGYFIYEVDGESPKVSIDEYKPMKNVVIRLKKLVPVEKKIIDVKVKH